MMTASTCFYNIESNYSMHRNHVEANHQMSDERFLDFYNAAQFITGLVIYPVICAVGISGNLLTLIVLNHPKMLTSTSIFLAALAIADVIKLLNDTLYVIVSILLRTHPVSGNEMLGYMYPSSHYIFNASVCVSSWLTVCIGVERYLYVCHATRVQDWCTIKRARLISGFVSILMSLVAIPSALRYKRISVYDPVSNSSIFEITLTPLGKNDTFMTVYIWTINLLRSVIPLCVLVILNTCIILSLRKQRLRGKVSSKKSITFMLVIVIVVFLVCITPDAVMSTIFGFGYVEANNLVKGIREFTDALLSINSAVNFTIYCLLSHNFRKTFRIIFCKTNTTKWFKSKRLLYRDTPTYEGTWATTDRDVMPMEIKPLTNQSPEHV